MDKQVIIAGTGVSGLLSAWLLVSKGSREKITIVDKAAEPGGLLRAFDYGEFGKFDYGMHNMLETSIKELDKIIFDILPEEEWQLLEGSKRDIAGIFYNGKVQYETPYFDLRNLNKNDFEKSLPEFFIHLNKKAKNEIADKKNGNAKEYATSRFGEFIASKTILPAIEKIHRRNAEELDFMATVFTPMTRVALFDEALVKELTESTLLRDHLAFVDQRNLPLERSTGRKGYYPVKYGMYRFVDTLIAKLKSAGVQFLTAAEIVSVEKSAHVISNVKIKTGEKEMQINEVHKLIWTSNIPLLGKYLGADFTGLKNDKPLKTVIISMLLDRPLNMRDLYYFFCYEPGFNTYRLTNFSAYCKGAPREKGWPISIEFLVPDEYLKDCQSVEKAAEEELFRFGITTPGTKVVFAKAEILESGFPMPSVNNIAALRNIRNQIKQMQLSNLMLTGILAEDNLFFQTDVLVDVYNKILLS